MALAVAGLASHRGVEIAGCAADVPFLSHFRRAIGLTDAYPYKEVADYLAANLAWSGGASVVAPDATVHGSLDRCVVWPGAEVGAGEVLRCAVRGPGWTVLSR